MFLQILGATAEFEHALMSERTRDGLAAARARGRTGARNPSSAHARSSSPARCTTPATTPSNRSPMSTITLLVRACQTIGSVP